MYNGENIEKVYTDRNICSFSDSEAAIRGVLWNRIISLLIKKFLALCVPLISIFVLSSHLHAYVLKRRYSLLFSHPFPMRIFLLSCVCYMPYQHNSNLANNSIKWTGIRIMKLLFMRHSTTSSYLL